MPLQPREPWKLKHRRRRVARRCAARRAAPNEVRGVPGARTHPASRNEPKAVPGYLRWYRLCTYITVTNAYTMVGPFEGVAGVMAGVGSSADAGAASLAHDPRAPRVLRARVSVAAFTAPLRLGRRSSRNKRSHNPVHRRHGARDGEATSLGRDGGAAGAWGVSRAVARRRSAQRPLKTAS